MSFTNYRCLSWSKKTRKKH